MADPILSLRGIRREFPSGERMVAVLADIDLDIAAGEMVAIIGASGSGKSTLMNLIGCLDQPTAGTYHIAGRETSTLDSDERAALRREYFGFIFQRYQLLGELSALGNVEIPAIYAGLSGVEREERAIGILERLGMGDHLGHRPGQLSGGQQQRVSIARALMNGAEVILADEPTGALDSRSGAEVLAILDELHAEGRTVIIVTHDMGIARRAQRIVELKDGRIVSDSAAAKPTAEMPDPPARSPAPRRAFGGLFDRLAEAFRMAVIAMVAHRLRTFLTMLGIIIGIASVVSVVALGQGSQQRVLADISRLGTNTLQIMPGRSFGDVRSGRVTTLVVSDAQAIAQQNYAAAVTPTVQTSKVARYGSIEADVSVSGVGAQYFDARGITLDAGSFFDATDVRDLATDVVIDATTAKTLFTTPGEDPVGKVIFIGTMPCRVIGISAAQQGGFGGGTSLTVFLPYTTVQARLLGSMALRSIMLRVADSTPMDIAEQEVTQLLTRRHGSKDFFIINTDEIRQTITSTTQTLALLIAAIALISLLVGGIGVMNIMLVSVSERVSEIGVRMAVGARRSDILSQFLIEAVLVCFVGGVLGVGAALGFGVIFAQFSTSFTLIYSGASIAVAFLTSTLIGVAFGYLPARSAARLDPVEALARD